MSKRTQLTASRSALIVLASCATPAQRAEAIAFLERCAEARIPPAGIYRAASEELALVAAVVAELD